MNAIQAQPNAVIHIGRLGENIYTLVQFDISEYLAQYPNATAILLNMRPGDTSAYPVANIATDEQYLYWTVADNDLTVKGMGYCELVIMDGEMVAKSIIYPTQIMDALDGSGDEPADWDTWLSQFESLAAQANSSAVEAAGSASDAADSASDASASARDASGYADDAASAATGAETAKNAIENMGVDADTLAPGSAATVEKSVDPSTGAVTLSFGIPQGEQGIQGPQGPQGPKGDKGDPGEVTQVEFDELKSALTQMQEEIDSFEGISDDVKVALLDCFAHVAWIDEHGQDYYDALEVALYNLVSISAVYTQSGIVRTSDSLDSLKNNLVVTAVNVDGTQKIIPGTKYELSGVLIVGTSTITVSYKNKTTTFTVNVSDERLQYELASGTDIAGQRIDTYTPVPAYNEDFTFIAKVTLRKNTSGATAAMLARRGGLNDDSRAVFRIGVDYSDGYIHFITNYLYSDYYAEYYTPGNISQSSDHELVWVVRNNNKILKKILYVDNNRILNKSENTNSYVRSRGDNIEIGKGATFDGVVSMFRIYNAALTDDEIEAMLNMDIF